MADVVETTKVLMIDRYANTAGAVTWFYDYLLTFSAECKYIWTKRWSLVKILYLLNRYSTLPFLILVLYHLDGEQRGPLSVQFCVFYDISVTILRGVQLLASTWLILIVVQSLSLNSPYFKFFLYLVFLATNIAATVFAIITVKELYPTVAYIPLFNACASTAPDSTRWLYLCQVPFNFLLLAIELYHYYRLHRLIAPAQPTKLLTAMYLDGVWYFLATITVKLTAGLVIVFAQPTYWYIASSADQAFTSTFIARLVLHLRSVASPATAVTYTDTSISHMFSSGASTAPKITVTATATATVAGTDQERQNLGVQQHQLKRLRDYEDGSAMFGEHSVGDDDQWRHYREDDALEMDAQKRSPSTSGYGLRRDMVD